MSYLDLPRLYFTGRFFANPSTINNKLANFHPDVKLIPQSHASQSSVLEEFAGFQYINPYGLANFCLEDVIITGCHTVEGVYRTCSAGLGTIESAVPYAKMTDLDPDQQSITQIFGLNLRIQMQDGSAFEGPVQPTSLQDLWYSRVPSGVIDEKASGFFQSLIPIREAKWNSVKKHSILARLRQSCVTGVSIKFVLDAYHGNRYSTDFNYGRIVGIIGPGLPDEPVGFLAARRLSPLGKDFGPAFWKLDLAKHHVTIDLSNSASLCTPAGESIDLGRLRAGIFLGDQVEAVCQEPLDYSRAALMKFGGIVEFPINASQARMLETHPLELGTQSHNLTYRPLLREHSSLKWINCDPQWLRLEAGQTARVSFHAREGGRPAAGETIQLDLTRHHINNRPRSGIEFPSATVADERGCANVLIRAYSPRPLPPRRSVADSQIYYLGGPWQEWGNLSRQSGGGALSVLVHTEFPHIERPTWRDHVEPIFSFYARLYPGICIVLGLGSYEQIHANASFLRACLELSHEHPLHFPPSRDLSRSKAKMISRWFDCGMPVE